MNNNNLISYRGKVFQSVDNFLAFKSEDGDYIFVSPDKSGVFVYRTHQEQPTEEVKYNGLRPADG